MGLKWEDCFPLNQGHNELKHKKLFWQNRLSALFTAYSGGKINEILLNHTNDLSNFVMITEKKQILFLHEYTIWW